MLSKLSILSGRSSLPGSLLFLATLSALPAQHRSLGFSSSVNMGQSSTSFESPVVMGTEEIMQSKAHGSCESGVQADLRWSCDRDTADRICCFNRHYAEHSGYFAGTSFLLDEANASEESPITFYDSVTGYRLFTAPVGRSFEDFVKESKSHGWPSFRDAEVDWEHVRVLPGGEAVSAAGTHLGHNIPDGDGNRYCINLVSVAGKPV